MIIVLSVLGGSFIGPSSNMLDVKISWLKVQWGCALRMLYCFPCVIIEALITKNYWKKLKNGLTRKTVIGILVTPIL